MVGLSKRDKQDGKTPLHIHGAFLDGDRPGAARRHDAEARWSVLLELERKLRVLFTLPRGARAGNDFFLFFW
jgi:hypothetical protein